MKLDDKTGRSAAKIFLAAAIIVATFSVSCNKKCRALESTNSGLVVGLYDFKECFPYATFNSTLIIDTDTGFANYQASHFKTCAAQLDAIDFSKNVLLGFKTETHACNAAFHRNISIDTTAKTYTFTVTIEKCDGCGTQLMSTNFLIGPKIPAGYQVNFVKKDP
ncbi:MAG: hypothetical protein KG003_00185 [Bacteroidetes bacterium]|nr:hypothetical protein [Bacteroidota bacterium]